MELNVVTDWTDIPITFRTRCNECGKEILPGRAFWSESFVWIDIESSKYTDDTLKLYLELFSYDPQIGIVIQSALRRSASDLLHLFEVTGSKVRLVKGAYNENEQIA